MFYCKIVHKKQLMQKKAKKNGEKPGTAFEFKIKAKRILHKQ